MRVSSTIPRERERVRELRRALPDARRKLLTRMGYYLLGQQGKHFDQLAETGSSNGVTWPEPSGETLRRRRELARRGLLANADPDHVGILTGRLAKGFRFKINGQTVFLTNTVGYANAFAHKRPIFPAEMPATWQSGCEAIVDQGTRSLQLK